MCLIPYRTDHPFNKVCSPTKIMDYMGTGRPIVSTALPECRLYEGLFHVATSNDEFIAAVGSILAAGSDDGRSSLRFDWRGPTHADTSWNASSTGSPSSIASPSPRIGPPPVRAFPGTRWR